VIEHGRETRWRTVPTQDEGVRRRQFIVYVRKVARDPSEETIAIRPISAREEEVIAL
jgi:hypothetical protein